MRLTEGKKKKARKRGEPLKRMGGAKEALFNSLPQMQRRRGSESHRKLFSWGKKNVKTGWRRGDLETRKKFP